MEDTEKSPIVERLAKYIDFSGLSNSQFADRAGIPRPSLSQLLHGRNKSLNNQLLSKLNDAFPDLNIEWLLFGRGDMVKVSNFEFSGGQTNGSELDFDSENNDNQSLFGSSLFVEGTQTNNQNRNSDSRESYKFENKNASRDFTRPDSQKTPLSTLISEKIAQPVAAATDSTNPLRKKISSIIVFYSDNSFETFLPSVEA